MKGKLVLCCAAAVLIAAVTPGPGFAQITGFRVGIAPPQFGFPPAAPVFIAPPPVFIAPGPLIPRIPARIVQQPVAIVPQFPTVIVPQFPTAIVPQFPTVIVPNHVLLPGQTIVAPPVINPPATVFFPANPIQPSPPFVPHVSQIFPTIGIPRAEVIRQFGQPSVTIVTSTDETLFFPGGPQVIIRNGRVAGAK